MANPLEGCFLFEGSGEDGFFRPLDDFTDIVLCMSESNVLDYIRAARPDLFKKLHGLPVKTFEDPVLQPRAAAQTLNSSPQKSLKRAHHTRPAAISIDGRPSSLDSSLPSDNSQTKLLEIQHKRHVQPLLLNGFRFVLRRVRHYNVSITCACAACSQTNRVLESGDLFLTLIQDSNIHSATFNNCTQSCYSLLCVESLFKGNSASYKAAFQGQIFEASSDGTFEMPKRKRNPENEANLDVETRKPPQTPVFPFNYPSNSNIAKRLRKERDDEIKEILKADEKFEHAHNEYSSDVTRLPDLTLRRPPNHTNIDDRYKKQGLTRLEYGQHSRQRTADRDRTASLETDGDEKKEVLPSPTDTLFEQEIVCYCREPDDGDGFDVIKCSGEYCLVGYFHLRCIELREVPNGGEEFSCQDCLPHAKRQLQDREQEDQSALDQARTDGNTLVASSESEEEASSELSEEADNDPKAEWAEKEQAIVKGALTEISEAFNQDVDMVVADSEDEEDEVPEEEEALTSAEPTRSGFLAINNLNEPRNHQGPQSVSLPIRSRSVSPDQLDGHLSPSRKPTSPRYLSPHQTRHERRRKRTASEASNQLSPPAGYTSAPFHALAPFIYPSLSDDDLHALTPNEARYVWCWRATCPVTPLVEAVPKMRRDQLEDEADRATRGLGEWWAGEVERTRLEEYKKKDIVPSLSGVLARGDL